MWDKNKEACVFWNLIPDIGPRRFQALCQAFGDASHAREASYHDLNGVLGGRIAETVKQSSWQKRLEQEIRYVENRGVQILVEADPEFPVGLRSISDPPICLYVLGEVWEEDVKSVAIVGSRHPTPYGTAVAEKFSRDLAGYDTTVISGLARGIDASAHKAALRSGGRTLAVLGSGLGRIYPPEHQQLANDVIQCGALLSEFPFETPPDRPHFPRRNRLIAGLSCGVVVVEGSLKSGALITARFAADYGREVFSVPGHIHSPLSQGPHKLLREGAVLVECVEDILSEIPSLRGGDSIWLGQNQGAVSSSSLLPDERRIMNYLDWEPQTVDALALKSGQPAHLLASHLLSLEIKGAVRVYAGKKYALAKLEEVR